MEEKWESAFVQTNGIRMHYHRTHGAGPVVLLAHGFSDNGRCWRRLAGVIGNEFDLVMVDARGHGLSDAPETGYSLDEQAADIAGFLLDLGLDGSALMGHSMGASSVAAAAAGYPGLVTRIVLEDPPWRETRDANDAGKMLEWKENSMARKEKSIEEIIAEGKAASPTWDDEEFEAWAESKKQLSPYVFTWKAGSELADWREVARKITCPSLLITADPEQGAIVTTKVAEEAGRLCQSLEVLNLPGVGHNIRREAFDGYVAGVRRFLKG